MSAPASFPFYPDDFLAGTMEMSTDEVGAYIRLLSHQWNRGSIPVQTEKQQRLAGGSVSADVISKFEVCEDGLLRNARMEFEREKQCKYRDAQALKGRLSGQARRTPVEPRLNPGSVLVGTQSNPPVPVPVPVPIVQIPSKPGGGVSELPKDAEDIEAQIDQLYSAYPKHVGVANAKRAIRKALKKATFEVLFEAVTAFAVSQASRSAETKKFIPDPATWFNAERWTDERTTWTVGQNGSTVPPHKQLDAVKLSIETHPANREYVGYDERKVTPELKTQLSDLRKAAEQLTLRIAKGSIHG
jgi:uncharacterized protein YdaU (DUF1376 family)